MCLAIRTDGSCSYDNCKSSFVAAVAFFVFLPALRLIILAMILNVLIKKRLLVRAAITILALCLMVVMKKAGHARGCLAHSASLAKTIKTR